MADYRNDPISQFLLLFPSFLVLYYCTHILSSIRLVLACSMKDAIANKKKRKKINVVLLETRQYFYSWCNVNLVVVVLSRRANHLYE